jgi:hypothetical protein
MSQEVKIGVNASTGGAVNQLNEVEKATQGVADAAANVGKATKAAADGMRQMESIAQRLKHVQEILSREFGRQVDPADATVFLHNFDRMRSRGGFGAQRMRAFDSFENWYSGHGSTFRRPGDADRHRRYVMGVGMQNTQYAQENGVPAFPPSPGGNRPERSPFNNAVQRAGNSAMSFGKGMLAIAGISTIASAAAQAVDMATEEAVGLDTLKRRSGDLGGSFEQLRTQVRAAADGMGLTFVEAQNLANQLAKTTGNFEHAGDMRTSMGFARSFGIDPAASTQFFGTMRRLGVQGSGDNESRRLALMIADAIEKGGYTAKADEVLKAVADFSSQAARITLSTPNTEGFASYLAGLTRTGIPGLDPAGAAGMLGAADASVRRGGGMGEAGLNFSYAALMRRTRGLNNPVMAEALWEGGLFGTTAGVFGGKSALGAYYKARGIATPELNDTTNFEKMRGLMRQQYGNSPYYLDAMKNYFGLSSISQASALADMTPADIHASQKLADRAGINLDNISGKGIQGFSQIAGASTWGDLLHLYSGVTARSDLTDSDRAGLNSALKSGDFSTLQNALANVVGTKDQEPDKGSDIRQSMVDLKDVLTGVGDKLFTPIEAIRKVVVGVSKAGETGPSLWDNLMNNRPMIGATPMPDGATPPAVGSKIDIGITGDVTLPVVDQNGKHLGTSRISPYVKAPNAGVGGVGASGAW